MKYAILAIILIAISGGFAALVYAEKKGIIDILPFIETPAQKEYRQFRSAFPDAIGDFSLYSDPPIRIREECSRPENHPDTKKTGVTGEACMKTASGQYRSAGTTTVFFVNFGKSAGGFDVYRAVLKKLAKNETISGFSVMRFEAHEIGWYPESSFFDIIAVQEGMYRTAPDGIDHYEYGARATGENDVASYFLTAYPPARAPEF